MHVITKAQLVEIYEVIDQGGKQSSDSVIHIVWVHHILMSFFHNEIIIFSNISFHS